MISDESVRFLMAQEGVPMIFYGLDIKSLCTELLQYRAEVPKLRKVVQAAKEAGFVTDEEQ